MADVDQPLRLTEREKIGKGLNALRQEGMIPAVIHNHGQASLHVMAPEREIATVYKEAGKHHPLNLEAGSQKFLALIKDVHYNPVNHRMQHVVFQAIRAGEKVEAEIPLHLEGEIPAEKVGLVVLHQLDTLAVEALPKDLPDEIKVDATVLAEIHDKIMVSDLKVPANVTVLTEADHPVATVVETKAQISEESEEEAEAEAGEAAEGEEGSEQTGSGEEAKNE